MIHRKFKRRFKRKGKRHVSAKKAMVVAKKALHMVKSDPKWSDSVLAPSTMSWFNISSTPIEAIFLNSPPLGASENNRVGNTLLMRSIHIKFQFTPYYPLNTATYFYSPLVRILLVLAKDVSGPDVTAGIPLTEILMLPPLNIDGIVAQKNMYNRYNYKVLVDKTIKVMPVTSLSNSTTAINPPSNQVELTIYKKLNHVVNFDNNTSQNPRKNALLLYVYQDATSASVTSPANTEVDWSFWSRLVYTNV